MNPAQQQVVAQYQQTLQQLGAQIQQLMQQAGAGCQQMIAQNPTDTVPLNNALGAIEQQVKGFTRNASDGFSQAYERAIAVGPGEPAHTEMKRGLRAFQRWVEQSWTRFDMHWHVELYRNMWPLVQQGMQKPVGCSRCGAPIQRTTPHKSESITCRACGAVSQVFPETVVAVYFGGMPHYFAEQAAMEKRFAIDGMKDEWENHRDAEHAADRDRPDEPLERLQQREKMELDYWTTYAKTRVQYEGGTEADVNSLVDARMKQAFYDDMNTNDVWRAAHGQKSVIEQVRVPEHLRNVDEWGPFDPRNPASLEENLVHEQLLHEAMREPERFETLLKTLGYRDAQQRAMTAATFNRHYATYLVSAEGQALMTKSAMRAMNERMKYATASAAAGGILDPIEGVSLQTYGKLSATQAQGKPDQFTQLLAQHALDQQKWERVSKAWLDRMSRDTTGAIATEYSKAFMGQGQYGAAGAAAADNMAQGQMGLAGPAANAEPMSFEKYCEVSGAMTAWSKMGKDVSAGLDQHFKMTAMDVSNVSMYWSQKMMADISMFDKQSKLMAEAEKKYLSMG